MPIYEYECSNCKTKFEKLQTFSAGKICTCPYCGGQAARLISLGSFILKGTGWYVTDHPSPSRQKSLREQARTRDDSSSKKSSKKPEPESSPKPAATKNST